MAKIKNTNIPNIYGKGNEKIFTTDSGEKYKISNSMIPNIYGDGQEVNVKKVSNKSSNDFSSVSSTTEFIIKFILVLIGIVASVGCGKLVDLLSYII